MSDVSTEQVTRLSRVNAPFIGEWQGSTADDCAAVGLRWGQVLIGYCKDLTQIYQTECTRTGVAIGGWVEIGKVRIRLTVTGKIHQSPFLQLERPGESILVRGALFDYKGEPMVNVVEVKGEGWERSLELDGKGRVKVHMYMLVKEGEKALKSDSVTSVLTYYDTLPDFRRKKEKGHG